ncbi:MAG: hypothetical protein ACLP4V_06855 [Methylocella sp.]
MTKLEVIETPAGHMFCPRREVTGVRIPMRLNDVDFAKVDRGLGAPRSRTRKPASATR